MFPQGPWTAATDGLEADLQPHGGLGTLQVDRELFQELLHELAKNAVLHRRGRPAIRLSVQRTAIATQVLIDDDGPGIPAEHRARVLLPMHRLCSWDEVRGHGMGLALVARIAQVHGGSVAISDSPLGGCRVQVSLPR